MYRRAVLGLGYLPQETSIFRGMTVEQNIMAVLEISEEDSVKRQERLNQLLGDFHIERLRQAPAMALWGGERRRVEIARALAATPSIILLEDRKSTRLNSTLMRNSYAVSCLTKKNMPL